MKTIILSAFALVGVLASTTISSAEKKPCAPMNQTLILEDGSLAYAIWQGKTYSVFKDAQTLKSPLSDGEYALANGGWIKIEKGVVIDDAFGAIRTMTDTRSLVSGVIGLG